MAGQSAKVAQAGQAVRGLDPGAGRFVATVMSQTTRAPHLPRGMSRASSHPGPDPVRPPSERSGPIGKGFGWCAGPDPAPGLVTCSSAGTLTASAQLLAAAGCSSHSETTRPAEPATVVATSLSSAPPRSSPVWFRPTAPVHLAVDATGVCIRYARAAGDVDTATTTLGRARQAAARAYGTPQLQALYDDAGEGRNREQESWQQHHARVTVTVRPDVDHLDEPGGHGPGAGAGNSPVPPGTPVAVIVTGTARGADGWSAPTDPYRLDCLTLRDPVAGWLVDDVAVSPVATTAG